MPMRIALAGSALLVLLALARPDLLDSLRGDAESVDPCRSPLAWRVEAVDPGFGFSVGDVERAVREAARVWEEPAGRDLFRHDSAGGMAIRLVYDERQQYSERRMAREAEIRDLAADVREQESLLRLRETQLEDARDAHERRATRATAEALRRAVDRFNGTVQRYNAAVERYNGMFDSSGSLGPAEVRAGDLRSHTRTLGGRVVSTERTLTIAVASDYQELVLVLAHELGHALGIEHLDAPDALMARQYRQDDVAFPVVLSAADLHALATRCP